MQAGVSQHAPAKFLVVETLMVIVPYTGEPPVLNFDNMEAYITQVFFILITTLQSVHINLGKPKSIIRNLFQMKFFLHNCLQHDNLKIGNFTISMI